MPDHKPPLNDSTSQASSFLRGLLAQALAVFGGWFSLLRTRTEDTRHHLKEAFYTTSDQVLEKAEETRKSVKLRMAILEIEHHLNRLYPQIGKQACDLAATNADDWATDADLRTKIELAEEYRARLGELRGELESHQQRSSSPRA